MTQTTMTRSEREPILIHMPQFARGFRWALIFETMVLEIYLIGQYGETLHLPIFAEQMPPGTIIVRGGVC